MLQERSSHFTIYFTPKTSLITRSLIDYSEILTPKCDKWTLGTGEAGLIPLFLWEAFRASDQDKLKWQGGLTRRAALLCAGMLVLPLGWRIFVFGWKGQWFEPGGRRAREKKM